MSKRLAFAAVIALALIAVGVASGPRELTTPLDRAVAIATLPCGSAQTARSSGVVIDDRTVLTVAHALFDSQDFAVLDSLGRWHDGRIRHLDVELDLATIEVGGIRSTRLAGAEARVDDQISMHGAASSGTVRGEVVRRVRMTAPTIGSDESSARSGYELALDIDPGDSGAGVFDANGDIAALVFARSTSDQSTAWATSSIEFATVHGRRDAVLAPCESDSQQKLDLSQLELGQLAASATTRWS